MQERVDRGYRGCYVHVMVLLLTAAVSSTGGVHWMGLGAQLHNVGGM